MGLFSRKPPPLRSYVGVPLGARLADPAWSGPIAAAGFDPATADLVQAVGAVMVSKPGFTASDGMPFLHADTGILVVQHGQVGIAVPDERHIVVVRYDNHGGAELNVGNTGMLKLVWAGRSYGIVFTGTNVEESPEDRALANALVRLVRV